jgi:hypothetical protein
MEHAINVDLFHNYLGLVRLFISTNTWLPTHEAIVIFNRAPQLLVMQYSIFYISSQGLRRLGGALAFRSQNVGDFVVLRPRRSPI